MACIHHRRSLPAQLYTFISIPTRLASTTAPPSRPQFPYPTNPRPTPHQIFHLPHGTSQQDIKTRYYDLVRTHHPDSAHTRSLSPSERHARFQAITAAYEHLRGKAPLDSRFDPYPEELARRNHAYHSNHNRRAEHANAAGYSWNASADDRWKDRLILIVGIITLAAGLAPGLFILPLSMEKNHRTAASNLSQARNEAKELGEERRKELRKRARDIKAAESRLGLELDSRTKDDAQSNPRNPTSA